MRRLLSVKNLLILTSSLLVILVVAVAVIELGGRRGAPEMRVDPNSAYGLPELLGLEPILQPETRVLSPDEAALVTAVVVTNGDACDPALGDARVPCEFDIAFSALPDGVVEGSVVASDVADAMPDGLLARVTGVEGTAVHAIEATLGEALVQGEFKVEEQFGAGQVRAQTLAPGVSASVPEASAAGVRGDVGGGLAFGYALDHTEIAPGVYADGGVSFDVGCGAYGGLTWEEVWGVPVYPNGVYFEASCGVTQDGSITITSEASATLSESERVAELDLEPITFFVGPLPVVLVPRVAVDVTATGEVTVGMSFGAHEHFGAKIGVKYNDGFETIKDFSKDFSSSVAGGSGRLTANAGVVLHQSLLLYGLAGPRLSETLYVDLEGNATGKPLWCINGGLRAQASLYIDLEVKELSWGPETLFDKSVELGCAPNSAPSVHIIAPSNGQTVYPGSSAEPLTFIAVAEDPEEGQLGVTWSSDRDGQLGTSGWNEKFNANNLSLGTHVITATATDSDGASVSQSVTVTASEGKPTVVITAKDSSGAWTPVTSLSGTEGGILAVRAVTSTHLGLGINTCLPVTWSGGLPVTKSAGCDFLVALTSQGNYQLTATTVDADGKTAVTYLAVSVGATPTTPQLSPISVTRTSPAPQITYCDGCSIDWGEIATLYVSYNNYSTSKTTVRYEWFVQKTGSSGTGPWVALSGTDASPNVGSSRTFAAPTEFKWNYTFVFKVNMINQATGAIVDTETFTLTYSGPPE